MKVTIEITCQEDIARARKLLDTLESEEKKTDVLALPLTDIYLSVRSENCLKAENVKTVGDLVKLSRNNLLAVKNLGRKSIREIEEVLAEYGLKLGMHNLK